MTDAPDWTSGPEERATLTYDSGHTLGVTSMAQASHVLKTQNQNNMFQLSRPRSVRKTLERK